MLAAKASTYDFIKPEGRLKPGTSSTICTAIAKSIELTFVTVSIALIGQKLSRRALLNGSRGITIAEMQIRTWILQPGSTVALFGTVYYAALSFLGALALVSTLMAMLYTTASDALGKLATGIALMVLDDDLILLFLVSPSLQFRQSDIHQLSGTVNMIYGNRSYTQRRCLTQYLDPGLEGETCITIEHSGQSSVSDSP